MYNKDYITPNGSSRNIKFYAYVDTLSTQLLCQLPLFFQNDSIFFKYLFLQNKNKTEEKKTFSNFDFWRKLFSWLWTEKVKFWILNWTFAFRCKTRCFSWNPSSEAKAFFQFISKQDLAGKTWRRPHLILFISILSIILH